MRVTQSFDTAQDRELAERQMGVFRQPQSDFSTLGPFYKPLKMSRDLVHNYIMAVIDENYRISGYA